MKRARFLINFLFILLAGLVLATTVQAADQTFAQRIGLTFSHNFHVKDQGAECAACHAAAPTSKSGFDDLLPAHKECSECHDVEAANGCTMCHASATPGPKPKVTKYNERFSHERHLTAARLECATCHANLDAPLPAEKAGHFPTMAECMACHEQRHAPNECSTCHLPYESLRPRDHIVNWIQTHGMVASAEDQASCRQCHGRSRVVDCQTCHNGDKVLSPHPRNYVARHGQDAHVGDLSCAVCHDTQQDCLSCHRSMNVFPAGHQRPGWVVPDGGAHKDQAEFDLESCLACHDEPSQEPVCVRCHGK